MSELKIFEDKKIRTHWDEDMEEWFFAISDVCAVLAESKNSMSVFEN